MRIACFHFSLSTFLCEIGSSFKPCESVQPSHSSQIQYCSAIFACFAHFGCSICQVALQEGLLTLLTIRPLVLLTLRMPTVHAVPSAAGVGTYLESLRGMQPRCRYIRAAQQDCESLAAHSGQLCCISSCLQLCSSIAMLLTMVCFDVVA